MKKALILNYQFLVFLVLVRLGEVMLPTTGTYTICATIDSNNNIPERDESNNSGCEEFVPHPPLPNLTPWRDIATGGRHAEHFTDIDIAPSYLVVTPQATATAYIRNIGEGKPIPYDPSITEVHIYCLASKPEILEYIGKDYIPINDLEIGDPPVKITCDSWIPESNQQYIMIKVDPYDPLNCPNPYGCFKEYMDYDTPINDNETKRWLPDLTPTGIEVTK